MTVENIAFTTRFGAITVDVQDAANNPIIHVEISNVAFESGISHVLVSSQIPITSTLGEATVSAAAHTALPKEGGVPYCPAIFSTFEILPPLVKRYYLTVKTEPLGVAGISGEGWHDENVSVNLIAPKEIIYINVGVRYLFPFWDVDGLSMGVGVNEISVFMDANHTAIAHYIVQYYLTVRVDPIGVTSISGGAGIIMAQVYHCLLTNVAGYNFSYWDVDGVSQGETVNPITIFMNAPHTVTAHYVKIMIPTGWFVPDWFWWLLLLLILIILFLLIWLYLRRRRKKSEEAFHSGWTAWYYGYDLRKIRRM
ncbi:MAG: hypothetical protein QMD20_01345 [Candidatus Bathyarchaeia archaeon]|nr:hypothetical protein [Candidatus Bathyarchaeia archaeon]